ncbi:MAG TPA: hypothetical protein VKI17_01965, partial [Gemmataceae bacterium]|nr:hypothetical protein [Gemmataceae bacterium]
NVALLVGKALDPVKDFLDCAVTHGWFPRNYWRLSLIGTCQRNYTQAFKRVLTPPATAADRAAIPLGGHQRRSVRPAAKAMQL